MCATLIVQYDGRVFVKKQSEWISCGVPQAAQQKLAGTGGGDFGKEISWTFENRTKCDLKLETGTRSQIHKISESKYRETLENPAVN